MIHFVSLASFVRFLSVFVAIKILIFKPLSMQQKIHFDFEHLLLNFLSFNFSFCCNQLLAITMFVGKLKDAGSSGIQMSKNAIFSFKTYLQNRILKALLYYKVQLHVFLMILSGAFISDFFQTSAYIG